MTVAELKKMLPKQVNHNTLMVILDYLEQDNKIAVGLKGITWIHSRNENLRNSVVNELNYEVPQSFQELPGRLAFGTILKSFSRLALKSIV